MTVRTFCLKCGQAQQLDFGDLDFVAAKAALAKFDVPRECPGGWHVELGGWDTLWQFGKALILVYGDLAKNDPRVQDMVARSETYRTTIRGERAEPELLEAVAA
jgi:hypothetical protein